MEPEIETKKIVKEVVKEEKKIIGIIKIKRNSIIVTTTINKDILLIEIYFL